MEMKKINSEMSRAIVYDMRARMLQVRFDSSTRQFSGGENNNYR